MIDLRSDTLTRPTPEMRRALAEAEVGDDVYGEDPTVHALEERVAEMFGKESALFMPTGSMANVIALALLVQPGEEALCEARAHSVRAELGAHGAISGLTTRTWMHPQGLIDREAISTLFAPELPYLVSTRAIVVENTHNFAGGTIQRIEDLRWVREFASQQGISVHTDGARIWNAHVATGVSFEEYGACTDTLAVCLSKGLGAPAGSLTLGSHEEIDRARVLRKRMGGGMRQVGVLAAAGLVALDRIDRLAEDHEHARILAETIGAETPQTNIVVASVTDAPACVAAAKEHGVAISAVGPTSVRMVTHADVGRDQIDQAAGVLAKLLRPS